MPTREIRHPLIRHKLGLMRRADISTKNFRELAQEVGALLTYEATQDLPLETYEIDGWCGKVAVEKIAGKKITVVPILRAGIGMLDGVLSLIPGAKVSAVGVARNEETLEAHTYLEKLAPDINQRLALIIDPHAGNRRLDGCHHRPVEEGWLQRDSRHGPGRGTRRHRRGGKSSPRCTDLHRLDRPAPERARLYRAGPRRCR